MESRTYTKYPPSDPARRRRRKRSRRGPLLALIALVVVIGGGLVAVSVLWPAARIETDPAALAGLKIAPAGEHVVSVSVTDAGGRNVPVELRGREIWPVGKLASGERLQVHATVRRSSLVGWLVGGTKRVQLSVTTPQTRVVGTLLHLAPDEPVALHFAGPAAFLTLKLPGYKQEELKFVRPHSVVQTGLKATGASRFGVLYVAAAARSWERLPRPSRVSWFPAGPRLQALVSPAPGATIDPAAGIELTFSETVKSVLGLTRPKLDPPTPGTWTVIAENTIRFRPSGAGFALGRHVVLTLPGPTDVIVAGHARTLESLSWSVPVGSTLRLHQLLAQLGYLPLVWRPATGVPPRTSAEQAQAALKPPDGTFTWRYPDTPQQLQEIWRPDGWTRMTQGAVMAFEHDHGLEVDGIPGPVVWHTLIATAQKGEPMHSYSYVLVRRSVPQNLTLWNDGRTILNAKINTGVPAAPTPLGTHAVFEHIPVGTMRGRNPDGSKYVDPGILWISYFYGGEAIHGFDRPTYGFPQSVGCVEAPNATAKLIWPYTPIGTLVSIVP